MNIQSFSEQYEAFLKFNHDQIQRRFSGDSVASCTYLGIAINYINPFLYVYFDMAHTAYVC